MQFQVTLFLKHKMDDKKEARLSFTEESYAKDFIPFILGKGDLFVSDSKLTRDDIVAHSTIQVMEIKKGDKKVIAYPAQESSAVH